MQDDIGKMAGKVWLALGEKGQVGLAQLPRMMKAKGETTYQALGWLAREGKICYKADGNGRTKVALTTWEQEKYQDSK